MQWKMLRKVLFCYKKKNIAKDTQKIFENTDRKFQKMQGEYATMDKK